MGRASIQDARLRILAGRERYDQMIEELERQAVAELVVALGIPERDVWHLWHGV